MQFMHQTSMHNSFCTYHVIFMPLCRRKGVIYWAFYCLSRKCSLPFLCLYIGKTNSFPGGIHHTVVVVDFLKIVFWGFGAVGGGTVAGRRGGKLLLGLIPIPPFSSEKGGSGGGGGGKGGHW